MNKISKIFTRCMVATALLLGWGACTDDYYQVESEAEGGNSAKSLLEVMEQRPELSDFVEVCKAAKFYTNEKKPSTGYTFAQLLDGQVVLTVYAPVNGSFDKAEMLQLAETDGYKLQQQFLANHIVRFRHNVQGNNEEEKLLALNIKWGVVDNVKGTYRGVAMVDKNLPARNGVLHTLSGKADFNYNLYELLRDPQGFDKFSEFFMTGDTAYFNSYASIPGDVKDGQTHYIDSVFTNSNNFFFGWFEPSWYTSLPGMSARLGSEDSSYVMIIPTDAAYEKMLAQYTKWFKYVDVYPNNTTRRNITENRDPAGKAVQNIQNSDSLSERLARAYMMRSLVMNINAQKGGPLVWKTDNFHAKALSLGDGLNDYLVTTNRDTLHNLPYTKYMHGENDFLSSDYDGSRTYQVADLFNGKEPITMSNGLAYIVDEMNIDNFNVLKRDIRLEASNGNLYQPKLNDGATARVEPNPADSIEAKFGKVSGTYLWLYKTAKSKSEFSFALSNQILAGKYDIYVVTVPNVMRAGLDAKGENLLTYEYTCTMNYVDADGHEATQKSATITTSTDKCDTTLVFSDFEFPVAYMGLTDTYPVLDFNVSRGETKKGNTNQMCIDFIYLKAKED